MPNDWESSWVDFYAKHRLEAILNEDRNNNGPDSEIDRLGKQCVEQVVPRLLGALREIKPVLLHGDLSGTTKYALIVDGAGMLGLIWILIGLSSMTLAHFTATMNTRLEFRKFDLRGRDTDFRCSVASDLSILQHTIRQYPSHLLLMNMTTE